MDIPCCAVVLSAIKIRKRAAPVHRPFHFKGPGVEGSEDRPLAFSQEGIALEAESGVLHSQSRMLSLLG